MTKAMDGIGGGVRDEKWERSIRAFDGTSSNRFPIPQSVQPTLLASSTTSPNASRTTHPTVCSTAGNPAASCPERASGIRSRSANASGIAIRERMIALQEELDWECYRLYGLVNEDLTYGAEPPPLRFGWRAFEIAMRAKMESGKLQTTWFERHRAAPLPGPHPGWPQDYQDLVLRRMEVIATNPNIALIEQPEYKRRWNTEPWADQLARALRSWLLDRLESYFDFDGRMNDAGTATARLGMALTSVARLADVARQDPEFHQVGELYRDDPAFDIARLVAELVEAESVPLLPVLRYKPSSLRKRDEWEKTWALQRQEDAIDARTKLPKDHPDHLTELDAKALKKKQVGNIPVPPKYTSADFLKGDHWRLRGKLDVPKERWVSFPHCEGPDGTLVVAWAGYDHLQLARAISTYFVEVQERLGGRDDPRLVPLLACLIELLPWLKQWHNEIDPEFGVPMGDYFEGFIQEEARQLGKTVPEIKAWEPPQRTARRSRKSGTGTHSAGHRRGARRDSEKE